MRYALAVLLFTASLHAECPSSVFPATTKSLEYTQKAKTAVGELEAKLVLSDREVSGNHVRWTQTFTKESGTEKSTSHYVCSDEGITPSDEGTTFTGVQYGNHLETGNTWKWSWDGGGVSAQYDYRVTKVEKVTVPAGTFEAARVDYTATAHSETRGDLGEIHGTLWIAEGIGLVRQEEDDPALGLIPDHTTLELIARK